jgi:peptidoglycan/LPS O-acetylase OafA/YrhL
MPSSVTLNRITYIRGFAILAVVTIHVLSSLPGRVFAAFEHNALYIFIDQFCRVSVPLFLAVSGYGLMRKYENNWNLVTFFQRRILRLIPLYLVWSIGFWYLFRLIPEWYATAEPVPLWQAIVFGSDYHLYFVPLIFQFYFLFPILLSLVKRMPILTLVGSVILQAGSIMFFQWQAKQPGTQLFATDQEQYLLFISWLSYFVMGMFLAKDTLKIPFYGIIACCVIWVLSYYSMVTEALTSISGGLDPLYALKFTRLTVIPFALSSIIVTLLFPISGFTIPAFLRSFFMKVGQLSFIIFLCHTLVLRLIFGRQIPGITTTDLLLTATFVVVLVAISLKIEKN